MSESLGCRRDARDAGTSYREWDILPGNVSHWATGTLGTLYPIGCPAVLDVAGGIVLPGKCPGKAGAREYLLYIRERKRSWISR